MSTAAPGGTEVLIRRCLILEYITLGWNVVGSVIVILAAIKAHSVALALLGIAIFVSEISGSHFV